MRRRGRRGSAAKRNEKEKKAEKERLKAKEMEEEEQGGRVPDARTQQGNQRDNSVSKMILPPTEVCYDYLPQNAVHLPIFHIGVVLPWFGVFLSIYAFHSDQFGS